MHLKIHLSTSSNACFRLANPKFTGNSVEVDAAKGSSYFERLCLQGKEDYKCFYNPEAYS